MADVLDLVKALPSREWREHRITIEEPFPEPVTFVYRELSARDRYRLPELVDWLRTEHPDWPRTLCHAVAFMSVAHAEPALPSEGQQLELYTRLATDHDDLFDRLSDGAIEALMTPVTQEAIADRAGE